MTIMHGKSKHFELTFSMLLIDISKEVQTFAKED